MIKKIIIIISLCFFIFACGKKGDPVYKVNTQKLKKIITQKNILS